MIPDLKGMGLILLAVSCLTFAFWFGAHAPDRGVVTSPGVMSSDAPPGVRFVTVALGGFRGLLADILWVRASELQDEGKFFEVAQLADWITRLEPRYPEVWAYHAWNMAYNITAMVPDPADRWHWVENGVRLLRDEGIPSNPHDAQLYWELGWMYFDKVGGRWDEATLFYRINWAVEMTEVMGGGLVDYKAMQGNAATVSALKAAGLNPALMQAMDNAYGPVDWRLPETHAMYWGYCGRPYQQADSPWCERLIWMGLTENMTGGVLAFAPDRKIYQQGPRLDLAVKAIRRCALDKVAEQPPLVRLAAINFLREAVLYLQAFGHPGEAGAALAELKRMPDTDVGSLSTDGYIRRELQAEVNGVNKVTGIKEKILGFLEHSESWRRLKVATFAEGYERLARQYWDVYSRDVKGAADWDSLLREARARSLRLMPESEQSPQSPVENK